MYFTGSFINPQMESRRTNAFSVRCFANALPTDKTPPQVLKVMYSPATLTTGSVEVHLFVNEAIEELEGWVKVSDTYFTKVYEENVDETLELEDITGNTGSVNVKIDWIIPPMNAIPIVGTVSYDITGATNGDVVARLVLNKK
jgi:hypothetical protein